jgi:hypothetical protein
MAESSLSHLQGVRLRLPFVLPVLSFSAGAFEQPTPIRATMARAASCPLLLMFPSAFGDCVDIGSLPSVLVTAASLDRA